MGLEYSKPGDALPKQQQSATTDATGAEAAAALKPGSVYNGTVIARQSDGAYTLQCDQPNQRVEGAALAAPIFGGLMGLNVKCHVPPGTVVKFAYGSPSVIYATIPAANADAKNAKSRSLVWGPDADEAIGLSDLFSDAAEDLLEGETEITNLFGVAMEFLTTMIRMHAGDRASVECHLINDMVRLISSQYRHVSGLGEELIFDHGRPTRERTWSSYRHEVLGVLKTRDPLAALKGDEVDRDKVAEARVTAMGRSRFLELLGYAGDFIHQFVQDPPATMIRMMEESSPGADDGAKSGAGKSWIHQNSDGSIIMQSVADIRFERVCRIPVPVRFGNHEDPEITKNREYEKLDEAGRRLLKLPSFTEADRGSVFQLAYHIRSYSRWLSRVHSFARVLQLSSEYKVPTEAGSPVPSWTNGEKDKSDENAGTVYYETYSCMTMTRDGSIVMHDGYGGSVVMSNGNIQISASRHLDLECAGDMRLVAGGSIFMKALRNIEISATGGGLVLHGYAWLKGLCEKGTLWLRSNAVTSKEVPAEDVLATKGGGPVPEVAGYEESTTDGVAVLIESAAGRSVYRSEKNMDFLVDGQPEDENDNSANITMFTRGDLAISGRRSTDIHTPGNLTLAGSRSVSIATSTLVSNAGELYIGTNTDAPSLHLKGGKLFCAQFEAALIDANAIRTVKSGGTAPVPDPQPNESIKTHYNHVYALPDNVKVEQPTNENTNALASIARAKRLINSTPAIPWANAQTGPSWGFPDGGEYVWDLRDGDANVVPETVTQQYIRLDVVGFDESGEPKESSDTDYWDGDGYQLWNISTGSTLAGKQPRTKAAGGFGLRETQAKANDVGEDLHKPSNVDPADMPLPELKWLRKDKFSMFFLKRST